MADKGRTHSRQKSKSKAARFVTIAWGLAGMWVALLDFSLYALASWLGLMVILAIGFLIETITERPVLSYARAALASALLSLVLVIGVATSGGDIVLGAITWACLTTLALALAASYERIEPRP